MNEFPVVRDDDPEDVADKLSIGAAMWNRGEKQDALSWLRRAVEAASDSEADLRALELAKAVSALADALTTEAQQRASSPPPKPPPKPSKAPPPAASKPSRPPVAASRPAPSKPPPPPSPKPSVTPAKPMVPSKPQPQPGARIKTPQPQPALKTPARPQPSPSRPAALTPDPSPSRPAPDLDEVTTQMPVAPELMRLYSDKDRRSEQTAVEQASAPLEGDETEVFETMRRDAPTATREIVQPPEPQPAPAVAAAVAPEPAPLPSVPLAVGIRVRVLSTEGGSWIVPDDGRTSDGIPAIIVPLHPSDDLRAVVR